MKLLGLLRSGPPTAALGVAVLLLAGCSGNPQERLARHLERGRQYLAKGDLSHAAIEFRNAARADGDSVEAWYELGQVLLRTGDHRTAVACLGRAAELDPQHKGAQLLLSRLMATSRDPEVIREAEKRARAIVEDAPEDPEALQVLAMAELRLGERGDAEQHLEAALDRMPGSLAPSVELARVRLANKDMAGAEQVLKAAVQHAPDSAEPAIALGELYAGLRRLPEAEAQFRRAVELAPKNGAALTALAALQLRAGKRDEAGATYLRLAALTAPRYKPAHALFLLGTGRTDAGIAELQNLIKAEPQDRRLRSLLIRTYIDLGKLTEAEHLTTQTLEAAPKDADALLLRAGLRLRAGRFTEAEADLTKARRFEPTSGPVHLGLARFHLARGEALLARQELDEAVRRSPDLLPARLELARLLLATGGPKAALAVLDAASDRQRRQFSVIVQRNAILLALGNVGEARRGVDQALRLAATPEVLIQDAQVRFYGRDFTGARASLERVLAADPENVRALEGLVATYMAVDQTAAGIEKLHHYASLRPNSASLQVFVGNALVRLGRRDEARKAYLAAKTAEPKNVAADLALARVDLADGRKDAARTTLTNLIARGEDSGAARLLLGMVEESSGNHAGAIAQFRKTLDTDGNNVLALNNLAYLLAEHERRYDEALQFAQRASELTPDSPAVEDTIGWVLFRKGLYQLARTHLEVAAAQDGLAPQDAARRKFHLAMAYLRLGDLARGSQMLSSALKLGPLLPEAREAQQVLAETTKSK